MRLSLFNVGTSCGVLLASLSAFCGGNALDSRLIHYQTYGDPKNPALVMIHGMHSSMQTFNEVAPQFAQVFYVVTYDQRGHGDTLDVGDDYSPEILSQDLKGLLDSLGIKKTHLLAHSFGARTAVKFTQLFPETVQSLIVEDMDMRSRGPMALVPTLKYAEKLSQFPRTFASKQELLSSLEKLQGKSAIEHLKPSQVIQIDERTWKLGYSPYVTFLYGKYSATADLTQALQSIRVPVMFLKAAKGALNESGIEHIEANAPHAVIVRVPNSRHSIHSSNTPAFLQITQAFFNEVLSLPVVQ